MAADGGHAVEQGVRHNRRCNSSPSNTVIETAGECHTEGSGHFSGIGGIRPVMIDKQKQSLHLGEAQIDPDNGIIFNMTPSPGATSCLGNEQRDAERIVSYL